MAGPFRQSVEAGISQSAMGRQNGSDRPYAFEHWCAWRCPDRSEDGGLPHPGRVIPSCNRRAPDEQVQDLLVRPLSARRGGRLAADIIGRGARSWTCRRLGTRRRQPLQPDQISLSRLRFAGLGKANLAPHLRQQRLRARASRADVMMTTATIERLRASAAGLIQPTFPTNIQELAVSGCFLYVRL